MVREIALAFTLAIASTAAAAQPRLVGHNGSLMEFRETGVRQIEIRYAVPRPALAAIGVVPGMVLLRGTWRADVLSAVAYVFAPGCPPFGYPVAGSVDRRTAALVVEGLAPVVDAATCFVLGVAPTANSVLVFTPEAPR